MIFRKNKKLLSVLLGLSFVLQQSLFYQALAIESNITDNNGNAIPKVDGEFNIGPDIVDFSRKLGFKEFRDLTLAEQDVLNFLYNAYTHAGGNFGHGDIDTFVALVQNGVNIQGVLNALTDIGGELKQNGNLVFISPKGVVVGASGILNVGSLSVITPSQDNLGNFRREFLPSNLVKEDGSLNYTPTYSNTHNNFSVAGTMNDAVINNLQSGYGQIFIDGKVLARGDVNLNGSEVKVNGTLLAGVGKETSAFIHDNYTDTAGARAAADKLFEALVNTDNMNVGNQYSGADGKITITSSTGITTGANSHIKNFASNSNTTLTNTGSNGIDIGGEVSNPNGKLTVENSGGKVRIASGGNLKNRGELDVFNKGNGTGISVEGSIDNRGSLNITNETGSEGISVSGNILNNSDDMNNNVGDAVITNKKGNLHVTSTGKITSKGNSLAMKNYGNGEKTAMNIEGHVIQDNNKGTLDMYAENSDIKIGHANNNFNVDSNGKITIKTKNGSVLNNGVAKTLIRTTENADIEITAENGSIGTEVGPCENGICTGIGPDSRDLTKSVNTSIDGTITAESKGTGALINMASLDKNMNINRIHSDGRVILLADDSQNKGQTRYDILNKAVDNKVPNVQGTGISIIASGNIGETENKLTFIQKNATFGSISDQLDYVAGNHENGVDMLAIGDINVKGLDNPDGTKNDTYVCAMISRTGDINAEFSGNTYIGEITAQKNINIVNRGKDLFIDSLGIVPSYPNDYYGPNGNITPENVKITGLDLGTPENPNNQADSTVVVKKGKIAGQGKGRPDEQDLTITADNAYAGGYHFHNGKDRVPGKSYYEEDSRTSKLENPTPDTDVSIRAKAVRPDDVTGIDRQEKERNYYYGGSSQGDEPNYDVDGKPLPEEQKGTDKDDDNLVVPDPDKPEPGPEPDDEPQDEPTQVTSDDTYRQLWNQRVLEDNVPSIDKRQYMRFDTVNTDIPIQFESATADVGNLMNISRGGVQVSHNGKLKVGDIVPVHVKYGTLDFDAQVKIVSANDVRAGGEFVNLDSATKNKLLFMNLMIEEYVQAKAINNNISLNTINIH